MNELVVGILELSGRMEGKNIEKYRKSFEKLTKDIDNCRKIIESLVKMLKIVDEVKKKWKII